MRVATLVFFLLIWLYFRYSRSILGLPLIKSLCDFCFEDYSSGFANFADHTTPNECGLKLNEVMNFGMILVYLFTIII